MYVSIYLSIHLGMDGWMDGCIYVEDKQASTRVNPLSQSIHRSIYLSSGLTKTWRRMTCASSTRPIEDK